MVHTVETKKSFIVKFLEKMSGIVQVYQSRKCEMVCVSSLGFVINP